MGIVLARIRGVDLIWVDRVGAVLLAAAGILDAASQPHRSLGVVAVVALIGLTGSVAARRSHPVGATLVAVSALIVFEAVSSYGGDGSVEVAAIALNFYTLGRHSQRGVSRGELAGLFAYWLAGAAVASYAPPGGTVGKVLGPWAFAGVLPFAVGWTLERRRALTRELAAGAALLREQQEVGARRAAAEERNRMARELHDVVAHCLSVMVVQTGAAGRIVSQDADAARDALRVVERTGREALVELRRIVGVLRRETDEVSDLAAPGLGRIDALIDRARAAGLPVELHVSGATRELSPGVDLVAYRVVQEALTNALKHAAAARASVCVVVGERDVELTVSDTGRGVDDPEVDGAGYGLRGMAERVALYGGELRAGPRPAGGFEVAARIPLHAAASGPASPTPSIRGTVEPSVGLRWPWLDPALAISSLVAFEVTVLSASDRRGPLWLNVALALGLALATLGRRRSPLLFLVVVAALGTVMNTYLTELKNLPLIGAYFALVPAYTVAAWAEQREAVAGLALLLGGAAASELTTQRGRAGDFIGAAFTVIAAWAAGRALRSYRRLTTELARTSARLDAEVGDRTRLAVAGERSRIARQLHAAVAGHVAAMVVQADAALRLIAEDPDGFRHAMDAIERTGRAALSEMRRILGVLRHDEDRDRRSPQPGIDQIYILIERARAHGRSIELTVNGDAETIAPGVELALYRILESALARATRRDGGAITVNLVFGERELGLRLTAQCAEPNGWPTDTMRERLALCDGRVDRDPVVDGDWTFSARVPRLEPEAFG
jgi:signal transduction histidine kinase